ncbi:MAG: S9 family peptidase [Deltaproteobacteria bacterium]|nr:MAG: S9 family peptidase [Deltaproteobacteria bacterium]
MPAANAADDPYLWLEDVTSDRALAWAREHNQVTQAELEAIPSFATSRDRIRAILDSKDKTPYVTKRGAHYYNFWRDDKNPRGLWRRTSLAEYRKPRPAWDVVIDLDALATQDKESWVWQGASCLYPKYERCLVLLSRGGADANVVREFDVTTRKFIDGGFAIPEAKSSVAWKDLDTIYVTTDFGPDTLTASGYPRFAKEWKRGTKLAGAATVFEGKPSDVGVDITRVWDHGRARDIVTREITTFTSETFLRDKDGKLGKLDLPLDASAGTWDDQLLVTLRSDWTIGGKTWPKGALLAAPLDGFLAGKRDFTMLFEPAATKSLDSIAGLKTAIVVNELDDIHNKLYVWTRGKAGWTHKPFAAARIGALDTTAAWPVDSDGQTDEYWMTTSGFLTPSTLLLGALGKPATPIKNSPAFFDARGLVVEQHFATSRDGTRVPYFQISRDKLTLDGSHPTLLYGYGGFEVSLTPGYDAISGAVWEERGGVYVLANIRGGAEYGPAWHQAALTHNRQRAYDDFIAIAEDLIARKVTSTPHLGIQGGSNGGLLMGVMLTERPDLFGAIVCQSPLLDMKRYHKLLAGASWMEEYGDPDKPDDWAVLAKYSPYQNVHKGTKYPRTLFTTTTRDDRVHPGHARKMAARMLEQGHDILYYENIEGGHGAAVNNEQVAHVSALAYTFLAKQLGLN